MSLMINKKQFYILIILTIFLFFSSIWHFPLIIFERCSNHHSSNAMLLTANTNLDYPTKDSPTSKSTKPFISKSVKSVNHCSACGMIIANYIINVDYPIHPKQYLPSIFIPEYKEFIPELKPPKFI